MKSFSQSVCEDPEKYLKKLVDKVNRNPTTTEVFDYVQKSPTFEGDLKGIKDYIRTKSINLEPTKEKNVFFLTIEKNGKVSAVSSRKETELANQITNLLLKMPRWKPAYLGEHQVRCQMKLHLNFPID